MINGLELDEQAGLLLLRGLVAPTGTWRRSGWFQEHFRAGSFRRSLRGAPEVSLSLDEDPLACGDGLSFEERSDGLAVEARLDASSEGARRLRNEMRAGRCALAFSFRAPDQRWSSDATRRTVSAVDLNGGRMSLRTVPRGAATPTVALDLEGRQAAARALGDAVRGSIEVRIAAALAASERTEIDLRLALADAQRRELVQRFEAIKRRAR